MLLKYGLHAFIFQITVLNKSPYLLCVPHWRQVLVEQGLSAELGVQHCVHVLGPRFGDIEVRSSFGKHSCRLRIIVISLIAFENSIRSHRLHVDVERVLLTSQEVIWLEGDLIFVDIRPDLLSLRLIVIREKSVPQR